jgi:hypothetical protein
MGLNGAQWEQPNHLTTEPPDLIAFYLLAADWQLPYTATVNGPPVISSPDLGGPALAVDFPLARRP